MAGRPRRRGSDFVPSARVAQPYEIGNTAALKHGAWASDVPALAREVVGQLFAPELVERHPAVALRAAECWVRLRRAEADVTTRGEILEDGKEHPLLGRIVQWDNYLLAVAREYGATPRAEAQLVTARADAARQVVDLDAIRARGRAALEAKRSRR
jgi:hypothetical protein